MASLGSWSVSRVAKEALTLYFGTFKIQKYSRNLCQMHDDDAHVDGKKGLLDGSDSWYPNCMTDQFVHLNVHSEYSLIDGLVRIKPLVQAVADKRMPAVAMTDHNNLFAMVKFYRAALSAGVKPIVGVDCLLASGQDKVPPYHFTLLCQNQTGYHHLTRLVSRAYQVGQQRGVPQIDRAWLAGATEGLIALSGGYEGDVGRALLAGDPAAAKEHVQFWQTHFPNAYYLELTRTGRAQEEAYVDAAVALATELQLPVVATNAVRFIEAEDFEAHEARVCIHDGRLLEDPRRERRYSQQQFLRSPAEMVALFQDIPSAIENTVEIAKRCNLSLTLGKNVLPDFPIPDNTTIEAFLSEESQKGLEARLQRLFDVNAPEFAEQRKPYYERLQIELGVINQMGFPGYFLIVADFIRWAKENGVPVGPGRGSGAGSLVAYALGITALDPLEYDLLFERFLNPERVSMPDFDIDFCMEGRDRVIDYVADAYGRDSVAQIVTFGTMAAKAVIRDAGRVLGHPYGFVDKLAKLIPFELGMTLGKALAQEEQLQARYDDEEDVRTLFDLARSLEGVTRNVGKHAGGLVIAPSALTDFTPLYCDDEGANLVTQFDKDDVEAVGLVKFDFLGLRTLTIIEWSLQTINAQRAKQGDTSIDIEKLPLEDPATYQLLASCATMAVFQLESRGMRDLIKRLLPDCFEDVVALVALFRPGPLQSGMVDDFIDRKHGRAEVAYPHPDIAPILQPTYGVILYQEQVMQIAQVLAGYSLGEADILRRAMGKKKPEEMAKQRVVFVTGSKNRGVDEKVAGNIFDLMEKFAGYGFNKSHSAAYALIAYQTAWLKTHYPAAFMAAVLSSDMDNTDKVVLFVEDCQQQKLLIVPPDINQSQYRFTVNDEDHILYGLGAIKGVGEAAIETIIQSRHDDGDFKDLFDFCQRIDLRKANRRVLEALINSGAMDKLGPHRASMMASLDEAMKQAEQHARDQASGQVDLFATCANEAPSVDFAEMDPWPMLRRLQGEKDTLGYYLSGHPIDAYVGEIDHFSTGRFATLSPNRDKTITIVGFIIAMRRLLTKKGDPMVILTLDDGSARLEATVFSQVLNDYQNLLSKDQLLVFDGEADKDDFTGGLRFLVRSIRTLESARSSYARHLLLTVDQQQIDDKFMQQLMASLSPYKGGQCAVCIEYKGATAQGRLSVGHEWWVSPHDDLLTSLNTLPGVVQAELCY